VNIILIIKPTRCTTFSNLFLSKTLHVSDSSSVHHQEFFTVHTAMVYVIQILLTTCEQDQDGIGLILLQQTERFRPHPDRKLSANLYDIYHCCVYSK